MNFNIISSEQFNQVLAELTNKTKNIFVTKHKMNEEISTLSTRVDDLENVISTIADRVTQLEQEIADKNTEESENGGE